MCDNVVTMNWILNTYMRVYHGWLKWPQQIRFILVGGYDTVVAYGLYALFLWLMGGVDAQVALFCSYILSSVNSYFAQKFFVFNTRGQYLAEYFKCLMTWGVGYILNAGLLWMFITHLEWNPYGAQIAAVLLVTVNTYLWLKYMAFRKSDT